MNAQRMLARPTLVLNKNWAPIQTTPVQEAISLVAKGSAMIIDPKTFQSHNLLSWNDVSKAGDRFGDAVIRSATLSLMAPEVIVLTSYAGMAARSVVFSRKSLFKRDKYTCQYCGKQPGPSELTIEHVMPKSRGGISSWTNCVLACVECNKSKANRTPDEAKMKLRRVPKKPSWKALSQIPHATRRESWDAFISRAYWEIELEA